MTSQEIRQLRKDSGLTKAAFARMLGVSPTTVTYWETGDRKPPLLHVATLTKLKEKLATEGTGNDLVSTLTAVVVAGGIVAFLAWLFTTENKK